jgi:hypothetical protein
MPRKGTIRSDVAFSELAANRRSKSKARKTKVDGTQTEGENTMTVTQVEGREVKTTVEVPEIPATIVESTEAEVFAEQTEGQEVVSTIVEETVAAVDGVTTTQAAEQSASEPPKVSKRPYIALIEQQLEPCKNNLVTVQFKPRKFMPTLPCRISKNKSGVFGGR